jgi:hypothetical protein
MTDSPRPPREPPFEFRKLQFDYAWKWFSYHADQRVKMFNFMLVVFGFLVAAIVNAVVGKQQPWFTAILCLIGAALAWIFVALDSRNERLLRFAEDVLMHLEKNAIFGEGRTITDRSGVDVQFGILSRQSFEDKDYRWYSPRKMIRHRVLLRLVGLLMLVAFVAGACWILKHPQ